MQLEGDGDRWWGEPEKCDDRAAAKRLGGVLQTPLFVWQVQVHVHDVSKSFSHDKSGRKRGSHIELTPSRIAETSRACTAVRTVS